MNKVIKYYKKSVYGNVNYYIAIHVSPEMAEIALGVSKLTRRKTITNSDINGLEMLGYSFEEVIAP